MFSKRIITTRIYAIFLGLLCVMTFLDKKQKAERKLVPISNFQYFIDQSVYGRMNTRKTDGRIIDGHGEWTRQTQVAYLQRGYLATMHFSGARGNTRLDIRQKTSDIRHKARRLTLDYSGA